MFVEQVFLKFILDKYFPALWCKRQIHWLQLPPGRIVIIIPFSASASTTVCLGVVWGVCGVWTVSGCCLRSPRYCHRDNSVKTIETKFNWCYTMRPPPFLLVPSTATYPTKIYGCQNQGKERHLNKISFLTLVHQGIPPSKPFPSRRYFTKVV